jgi:murein DD-endopeptidase MepM/ murein hydrolase activator NlpD
MPADPREPGRSELLKDVTQERIWRYAARKGDDGATSIEKQTDGLRSRGGIWGNEAAVNGDPCGGPRSTPSWTLQKLFKCFPVFNYPAGRTGFDNSFSDDRPIGARDSGNEFHFHDGIDIGQAHCEGPRIRVPVDGFVLQTPSGVEARLMRQTTRKSRCIHCLDANRDRLSGRGGNYVYLLCRPEGMTFSQDEYLRILFTHLALPPLVEEGLFCRAGQEIGVMGNSGGRGGGEGGVHLHIQCNFWKLLQRGPGFTDGDRKGRLIGKVKDPVNLYAALLWSRFATEEESGYPPAPSAVSAPQDTPLPDWAQDLMSIPEWCPASAPPAQDGGDAQDGTEHEAAAGTELTLSTGRSHTIFVETLRDPLEYVDYEEQGTGFPERDQ